MKMRRYASEVSGKWRAVAMRIGTARKMGKTSSHQVPRSRGDQPEIRRAIPPRISRMSGSRRDMRVLPVLSEGFAVMDFQNAQAAVMPGGEDEPPVRSGDSGLEITTRAVETPNVFAVFLDESKGAVAATGQELVGFTEVADRGGFLAERVGALL